MRAPIFECERQHSGPTILVWYGPYHHSAAVFFNSIFLVLLYSSLLSLRSKFKCFMVSDRERAYSLRLFDNCTWYFAFSFVGWSVGRSAVMNVYQCVWNIWPNIIQHWVESICGIFYAFSLFLIPCFVCLAASFRPNKLVFDVLLSNVCVEQSDRINGNEKQMLSFNI